MHSMVIRASEPRRSADLSYLEPKISRKSLARYFPNLRAADAVTVFIDILRLRQLLPIRSLPHCLHSIVQCRLRRCRDLKKSTSEMDGRVWSANLSNLRVVRSTGRARMRAIR